MKSDVADYMRYYNLDRLHTTNGDMSPVDYEKLFRKVSWKSCAEHSPDERAELMRLRKENKELRMEKDILKKASALLLKETK